MTKNKTTKIIKKNLTSRSQDQFKLNYILKHFVCPCKTLKLKVEIIHKNYQQLHA